MSTGSGIHAGHRQRMKERFLAGGLDGFSDHEILELILFYAIPRRDVNELSHRLVERFGSFKAVFDADYEDLQKVGEYAVKLYIGVSVEKLYALLFDNKMMLLDTVMLGEGAVNSVHFSVRTIAEKALKKDASSIILIHNHPNGIPYPSDEDKRFSTYLKDLLSNFDIALIDHIIVAGRYYRPVFEGEMGENRFAAPKPFNYGEKVVPTGIRVYEPKAASDIPYKGNAE